MERKQRPTQVDEFRQTLSQEIDDELLRLAELPNIAVTQIHSWLQDQGYQGPLRGVYTWFARHRQAGEKAQKFNQLLKTYEGVAAEKVLQKLLVQFTEQLDVAITNISTTEKPLEGSDYLKILPHLGREVRSIVSAINSLESVRDRKALEMAGAARMAQELRLIFQDGPFEAALEEGIRSVMQRLEAEG